MRREDIADFHAKKMASEYRTMTMIREIQKGVPVWFDYDTYVKEPGWHREIRPCAAVIVEFNRSSFRSEIIAADNTFDWQGVTPMGAIRFDRIKGWHPLKVEELPLLISCEHRWPLLEILMKEGMDAWKDPKNHYKVPEKEK